MALEAATDWGDYFSGLVQDVISAEDERVGQGAWKCDLSEIAYESLFNLPYFNGYLYAETLGGEGNTSKLLRIRASDGKLEEVLDYGRSIGSCAPCVIARGRVLSGDLGEDRIVVTQIAENSDADWPGPFCDPQTHRFALPREASARLVTMKETGREK